MALKLVEGWDYLATADVAKRGWTISTAGVSPTGRRSSRAMQVSQTGTSYAHKWLPGNFSTLIAGVAMTTDTNVNTRSWQVLAFADGESTSSGVQMAVRHNTSTNCLEVYRGTTLIAADTLALNRNQYYYIEFKVVFHASAGSYELKVAGVSRLSGSGIATITTANAYANHLRLGCTSPYTTAGSGATLIYSYDDLYVCDGSGSINNDFLGDCRVDLVMPTAEGNHSDFTPSTGTDNSATVDEATASATDYNSSSTPGHIDTYGMADLTSLVDPAVFGVQPLAMFKTDVDGSRGVGILVRSGGSDTPGASTLVATPTVYISEILETNPNGSVPWSQSSVNAAEFGVKVIS